ncbi:hypothetical protein PVAP13_4NG135355 [Panicum virgatum]|uniref:Secreted protein n=1 Tax=Panicum virgatum TaxID=38727 RepID=A0A8T0T3W7_PANVG|nr:hypothetical protein PVAP13_4NG135355 [Panicum virgatum]
MTHFVLGCSMFACLLGAASSAVPSWGIIIRDHYCPLVPHVDSNKNHVKRMCYNRVKVAARQGSCLSSLLACFHC